MKRPSVFAVAGLVVAASMVSPAQAAKKVRFGDTSASAISWPVFLAQEKGFFAAEGLDVELTFTGNNTTVVQQLIGGSFDIGQTTFETTIRAIENGAPIVMTSSMMIKYSFSIMAQKEIGSVQEMKGKRVILALPKSALTVYWNRAVEQAGMKVADIEQVFDGSTPNRYAALVSGSVQAAALTQPADLFAADKGYRKIVDITKVATNFGFSATVASRAWLAANGDTMRAFLRANKKAVAYFYDPANRDDAIAVLAKYSKIDVDSATKTYEYYSKELRPFEPNVEPREEYVRGVVQLLIDIGDLKLPAIDPKKYADGSFLPK
jgi:NitT/TauT family transport system substrate-binding protein